MSNGKRGKKDYREFVLSGAGSVIFAEALQDTCESCNAVSCALCALYHMNRRAELRIVKGMTRKRANSDVKYMERGHIVAMNKKYDTQNRFEHKEWNCSNGNKNDYIEEDECVNVTG